jgi:hypothetical protein
MTFTDTDPDVSQRPVDIRPILLPESGDGQRRRRRRERQRIMRQRWLAGGSVVVAAVAAVALLRGTHTGTQKAPTPATTVPAGAAAPNVAPDGVVAPPSVLIQQVNGGRTVSLAAFLPSADGAGGTVLVFPAKTALSAVAANLPRHRAEAILALDDRQLAALFAAAGTLQVTVPGAGPVSLTPDQVPRFLADSSGDPLVRQRAFWDAWLTQVKNVPAAVPAQAALAQAVRVFVKGPWTVAVPPGTAGG